jgi:hypothetical protein
MPYPDCEDVCNPAFAVDITIRRVFMTRVDTTYVYPLFEQEGQLLRSNVANLLDTMEERND